MYCIEQCLTLNKSLQKYGLVTLTWGNASVLDDLGGVMAIKPSGVSYDAMDHCVLVELGTGESLNHLRPSVDTPLHLAIYKNISGVKAIIHTHSTYTTIWSQGCQEILCLGTTHADHFQGKIPLARSLTKEEIKKDYEGNLGKSIVECMLENKSSAVLIPHHGSIVVGSSAQEALENAITLEEIAKMAFYTLFLVGGNKKIAQRIKSAKSLFEKHYERKRGMNKYYGQDK